MPALQQRSNSHIAKQILIIGLLICFCGVGGLTPASQTAAAQVGLPTEQNETSFSINEVPPKPSGLNIYINDYANLLSASDKAKLQQQLQALDEAGQAQVSVLILPDTEQEPILHSKL
jgi:hypothetical protein